MLISSFLCTTSMIYYTKIETFKKSIKKFAKIYCLNYLCNSNNGISDYMTRICPLILTKIIGAQMMQVDLFADLRKQTIIMVINHSLWLRPYSGSMLVKVNHQLFVYNATFFFSTKIDPRTFPFSLFWFVLVQ